MSAYIPKGLGWHQDIPDFRDYVPQSPQVVDLLAELEQAPDEPPSSVDLRQFFPPVYDQLNVSASASHACVGLVEYFNLRALGTSLEASALFLHHTAARTGEVAGLSGLDLRSHLKAMVTFGLPPARRWDCDPNSDRQPADPMLFSFVEPYRSIYYVRLDARNSTGRTSLKTVRAFLAAGFPCAFGFSVPSSLSCDSDIPYRPTYDFVRGGQAVVAVGYDDRRLRATRGALLVRNSWGASWGDNGHGWLPYAYVEEQLASCFWTLVNKDWLTTEDFTRPSPVS